jgi:hypothetical protein
MQQGWRSNLKQQRALLDSQSRHLSSRSSQLLLSLQVCLYTRQFVKTLEQRRADSSTYPSLGADRRRLLCQLRLQRGQRLRLLLDLGVETLLHRRARLHNVSE